MKRFFRAFLLWLLIAVLPLHAATAAVGMSCANGHGNEPALMAGHHSAPSMDGNQHAAHDHEAAGHSTSDDGSHTSCSACSTFCSAPAVPATAQIAVPHFDGSEMLLAAPATLATGFIPEGPRRPPRGHSV
jgi:hypothetical protein